MIYGHGDDLYNIRGKDIINFSSNVLSGLQDVGLKEFLAGIIGNISVYPEPDGASLVECISRYSGIDKENILLTNGAVDAIYLIAGMLRGKNSAIVVPSFREYQDASLINKHKIRFIKDVELLNNEDDAVWVCNPCNPTGYVTDKDKINYCLSEFYSKIFIFDHSYKAFTKKEMIETQDACRLKNLIIINSFTKEYAIPGLRLGYIVAHRDICSSIKEMMMPWSVNTLAIEAGKFLLRRGITLFNLNDLLDECSRLRNEISKIEGIDTYPTSTHFFLCSLQKGTAAGLKEYLIDKHNILIRDASNFEGLSDKFFRITTQMPSDNTKLINALRQWISL